MDNSKQIHQIDMFNLMLAVTIIVSAVTVYTNHVQKGDLQHHNCEHFEQLKEARLFLNALTALSFLYIVYISWQNLTSESNKKDNYEANYYSFIAAVLFLSATLFNMYAIYLKKSETSVEFVF